jgi:hypothetical protein
MGFSWKNKSGAKVCSVTQSWSEYETGRVLTCGSSVKDVVASLPSNGGELTQ